MGDFWTTFFYIVVMAAVLVAAYVATKYLAGRGRNPQSRHIRILDRMMLGRDKHIVLVEVGDKNLLIGVTNQSISVLGDIDGDSLAAAPQDTGTAQRGVATQLRDFVIRMKDAPSALKKARTEAKKTRTGAKKAPKATMRNENDYLARIDDAIQRRKDRMTGRNGEDE